VCRALVAGKGGKMSYLWICPELGLDIHEKNTLFSFFSKEKSPFGLQKGWLIGFLGAYSFNN
jgi:hypothetical protein